MTTASYCRNCSLFLGATPGNFCPNCGQETTLHPPTVGEFAHELVGHYVALEGKLWKTLLLLFFKPAELTREYLDGRRRRYVLPLRLYLTASLLFFVVVKFAGLGSSWNAPLNARTDPLLLEQASAAMGCDKTSSRECESLRRAIELRTKLPAGTTKSRIGIDPDARAEDVLICDQSTGPCLKVRKYLTEKYQGYTMRQLGESVRQKMLSVFPYLMFCLLPVFALITRLIYWRRQLFYGEHMVYAFHIHSFAFFMMLAISFAPGGVDDVLIALMFVYFFLGLQRFFGGRWWATALRYLAIGAAYPLVMGSVAFGTLLYAVFV